MKRSRTMFRSVLTSAVFAGVMVAMTGVVHGGALLSGNGYSELKDPQQAGAEAATKAKAALGNEEAKVVLVFDSVGKGVPDKEAMLGGVTSVFDAAIVYGCSAYAPITQDCNTGTVGVLALGGDVKAVPAMADLEGGHEACGKKIGEALKAAGIPKAAGKVVLLFGACHVPSNDKLVGGVGSVLGEKFPVAGGAAKDDLLYYQGKVFPKHNLGLLLAGDFKCSFAAKNAPAKQKDRVIAVAGEAAEQALGGDKDKVALVFAFDCGGRRGQMGGEIDKELQSIRDAIGKAPLFGFYSGGETGPKDNDSPARGVGYHIVICAILAQ